MKRRLLFIFLLASPLAAQTALQSKAFGALSFAGPQQVYTVPFTSKQAGDTLAIILLPQGNPTVSEPGNTWTQAAGCPVLWMAPAPGTLESISVNYASAQYTAFVIAEYAGALVVDSCASLATGSSATTASNPITAAAGDTVIGFGWNLTSNYVKAAAIAPFTMESQSNIFLEDETQAAAGNVTSSATWPQTVNWTQGIIAMKSSAGQPTSKNFSFSGVIQWDDGTPIQGNINVQQFQQSQNSWATIGTFTPDASGNLAGTVAILTNFADIVTFDFALLDATGNQVGMIQPSAPGAIFQNISSVTGFKLVIQKKGCTAGAVCTIGAGSVFGSIQ